MTDDDEENQKTFEFPEVPIEDREIYGKVWSEQLLKQVELSTHRFLTYVESNETIKPHEI